MTPLQQHIQDWKSCTRCSLHKTRQHVCIVRGHLPCDILLLGEGPGESEDVSGNPFVGPAGQLLDQPLYPDRCKYPGIVQQAFKGMEVRYALTNLVGCIPYEVEDHGGNRKAGQPEDEAIEACVPRVEELIRIAKPKLIVCVGKMAKDWMEQGLKYNVKAPGIPQIDIVHPSFILRSNDSQRSLHIQRCIVTLRNATRKALAGEIKVVQLRSGRELTDLEERKTPLEEKWPKEPIEPVSSYDDESIPF